MHELQFPASAQELRKDHQPFPGYRSRHGVSSLGGGNGVGKRLIHLPVGGAVGQDKDILGSAFHLAAYGDDVEPAPFLSLPMLKLEIPFALLPAEQPFQIVFVALRETIREQRCQNTGILPDFSPRDAQQPPDVRLCLERNR